MLALTLTFLLFLFWQKPPVRRRRRLRREPADRGNRLFPTQVLIAPTSVVHYTPQWIGRHEQSIHMAHVASVTIDTGLLFSDVRIETTRRVERDSLPRAPEGRCRPHEAAHREATKRSTIGTSGSDGSRSWFCRASLKQPISLGVVDELLYSARRASASLPARAEPRPGHRPGGTVPDPRAIAAARRDSAVPQRPARRSLRRRDTDGHVRPPAARRGELRPRAE